MASKMAAKYYFRQISASNCRGDVIYFLALDMGSQGKRLYWCYRG